MNGGKRRYVQLYNFFYLLPSILSSALSVHFIRFVCLHFFTRFPLFLFSIYTTHIIRTDSLHTFFFLAIFFLQLAFFPIPFLILFPTVAPSPSFFVDFILFLCPCIRRFVIVRHSFARIYFFRHTIHTYIHTYFFAFLFLEQYNLCLPPLCCYWWSVLLLL